MFALEFLLAESWWYFPGTGVAGAAFLEFSFNPLEYGLPGGDLLHPNPSSALYSPSSLVGQGVFISFIKGPVDTWGFSVMGNTPLSFKSFNFDSGAGMLFYNEGKVKITRENSPAVLDTFHPWDVAVFGSIRKGSLGITALVSFRNLYTASGLGVSFSGSYMTSLEIKGRFLRAIVSFHNLGLEVASGKVFTTPLIIRGAVNWMEMLEDFYMPIGVSVVAGVDFPPVVRVGAGGEWKRMGIFASYELDPRNLFQLSNLKFSFRVKAGLWQWVEGAFYFYPQGLGMGFAVSFSRYFS